jgi:hypothetical protein
MSETHEFLGCIAVLDRSNHALVASLEFGVPEARARAVLARLPDVDRPCLVSWGNITREEATLVLRCEDDAAVRAELLDGISRLFSPSDTAQYTLFYCDPYRGE